MRRTLSFVSVCCGLFTLTGLPAQAQSAPAGAKGAPDLFLAIGRQDTAAVKALLARGADPNAKNTLGASALIMAAETDNVDIVKALLDAGAEVNCTSAFGTALTFAAYDARPEVVSLLLARGADVSASRPDRISILMLAARAGNAELVRTLLAKKAPVNATDNHGSTALSYAARAGKTEAARVLLGGGAKVDLADADGWTPLMHAAINGHQAVAALLIEKGADLKATDRKGRTALLLAASYGDHPEVVKVLLKGGAGINARDAKGRTAVALSEARGYTRTAALLRDRGARLVARSKAAPRTPRQAAEAALRQVEQPMQVFAKRTGCVSCHHEGIARFTTGFARARGYAIDTAFAREQEKRVVRSFTDILPLLQKAVEDPAETKHVPIVDVGDLAPTTTSLLLGLAEHQVPPSEALGAAAMVLARTQTSDGDWRFALQRVPVQSSFFTMTAMAIRVMQAYAPKQYAGEIEQRVARARQWLLTAPTRNTEDRVFRLLGLKWAGATAEERLKALEELRATQRPDGGWAQLPGKASDAYATGSALFALNQGGEVAVTDAVYRRGVAFLIRTQEDDGTWYVSKRAIPANNYFDAGFPYGQSQYVSHAAACWASMALILAADAPADARQTSR